MGQRTILIQKDDVLSNQFDSERFDLKAGKNDYPVFRLTSVRKLTRAGASSNNMIASLLLQDAPINLELGQTIVVQSEDGRVVKAGYAGAPAQDRYP